LQKDRLEIVAGYGQFLQRKRLSFQLLKNGPRRLLAPALEIISALNGDGLLASNPADIAMACDAELSDVLDALKFVQDLAPAGVAARDTAECLRLQLLRRDQLTPQLDRLLTEGREDLEKNRLPALCAKLNVSPEELERMLAVLRSLDPAFSVTTDVIVGYPGETEADFEDTRSLMEEAQFDNSFVFKYSPRPGTRSAALEDDVAQEEKERRNQVLLADQEVRGLRRNTRLVGTVAEVLCEGPSKRNAARLSGRDGGNRIVVHPGGLGGLSREDATALACETLKKAQDALDAAGLLTVHICPETMGKINQLGTFEEVLTMCGVDERFLPCVDFGHLNSRTHGEVNSREAFASLLTTMDDVIGTERARVFHAHFSKIEYTAGGEKRHLTFEDTQYGPEPDPLMTLLAEQGRAPVIICESDGTQAHDAARMMTLYHAALKGCMR